MSRRKGSTKRLGRSFYHNFLPSYACDVLFYGVVSAQTEKAVQFFLEPDEAVEMIRQVQEDEPALAAVLRVEEVELN